MYEEQIKQLRSHAEEHCPLDRASGICGGVLASEAANTIHQLSHHANDWEKIADHWRKKYEELERQMQEKT